MTRKELLNRLKSKINTELIPLIGDKCVIVDAPYYKNIGDVLIWQGELSMLQENSVEILSVTSGKTFVYKPLPKDVTIIFQGGGNIGDLYYEHTRLLKFIVKNYRENRIIVCGQTVYYNNNELFKRDFSELAEHSDFYFATRDEISFNLVKEYLPQRTLLIPDMAFAISDSWLKSFASPVANKVLYIARKDCEKQEHLNVPDIVTDTIMDWPVFEHKILPSTLVNTIFDRLNKLPLMGRLLSSIWDKYAIRRFRLNMVKAGVDFISPYETVVSERLHGCILAILLDKEVTIVDNSYGKNSSVYNTWLKDDKRIKVITK